MPVSNLQADNFAEAKRALEAAQARFDYATGIHIDAAILELSAAKMRLSAVLQENRALFFYPDGLDKHGREGRGHQNETDSKTSDLSNGPDKCENSETEQQGGQAKRQSR